MRKVWIIAALSMALSVSGLFAQRGTAEGTINGKSITVEYGRPSLQGRDMLSRLPVGSSWRMGMNAATTLDSEAALDFGDVTLAPGKYTLTAKRVSETDWHLIAAGDSGTHEIPLANLEGDGPVEVFTIWINEKGSGKGQFGMAWGEMKVGADFSVE